MESSKIGLSESTTVGELRHNLVRTTLAKQTLEYEKSELMKRIENLEVQIKKKEEASSSSVGGASIANLKKVSFHNRDRWLTLLLTEEVQVSNSNKTKKVEPQQNFRLLQQPQALSRNTPHVFVSFFSFSSSFFSTICKVTT